MVSVLAIGQLFVGSNTAEAMDFLKAIKILSIGPRIELGTFRI
jgi:hypothetical protein